MKIALVHNQCLPYRQFLFRQIAEVYDIDFFFFNQDEDTVPKQCRYTNLKGYKLPEFSDYWIVPKLKKKLSVGNYDLIVGGDLGAYNTRVAYEVARSRNVPFIPWILEWNEILHPRRLLRKKFENQLLSYASAILTPGINHRSYLLSRSVPKQKLHYFPNCLDLKHFEADLNHPFAKIVADVNQHYQIVTSIGRHVEFKGHEQLIRAQAMLEKQHSDLKSFIIIAGDGPLLKKHKKLARSLNLKNYWFVDHFVDAEEKRILFEYSKIFVLPSTRKRAFEAWGLVCNEAAFYGLPIIVSDAVGCFGEVVRHGENGFVFRDKQINELANAVSTLLTNPSLIESYRKRSKEISKGYSSDVMVNRFLQLIESFCG